MPTTHTTQAGTRRLFAAARAEPKSPWIVPGAAHVDLHAFARTDYERRVGGFLQARLRIRRPGRPATTPRLPRPSSHSKDDAGSGIGVSVPDTSAYTPWYWPS